MWSDFAESEDSPDRIRSLGGEGAIVKPVLYPYNTLAVQSTPLQQPQFAKA